MPTCIEPSSTRNAPNQMTATLETLSTNITIGNMSAKSRPARRPRSVTSAFACSKRSVSTSSRTNARITRMPMSCSRSTRLTVSILACICWNSGTSRNTTMPMAMSSTGTATAMSQLSCRSCCRAKITPPIARIGAETSRVKVISTSICTCCTSFVLRVMSDGAPNLDTSRSLNVPTRWKIAPRTSRPNAIAARAPK